MGSRKNTIYHLLALGTSMIWGTTFVSTKVLIAEGLTPASILFYRFLLAYILIWFFSFRRIFARNITDELLLLAAGLTGGSLYFVAENTALGLTLASNVSLIICTSPLITALLGRLINRRERVGTTLIYGSFIALLGVGLVVFNGRFVLNLNPWGDSLTIIAALMWSLYSILVKLLDGRYDTLFITRKVFFYGLLTLLPVFLFDPLSASAELLLRPVVFWNLLFLGIVASLIGYLLWNVAVMKLGAVRTANYIYIIPLVTMVTASLTIHESITLITLLGALLILAGVYIAEKGFTFPRLK